MLTFIKISRSHSDFHTHRFFVLFWLFLAYGTKEKNHYSHILLVNGCMQWYRRRNTLGGGDDVFGAGLSWRALSCWHKNKGDLLKVL